MVVSYADSDSGEIGWRTTSEVPTGETPTFVPGDLGFILISTGMVWFMIPGLGFFYAGMLRAKNALSLILLSFWAAAIVSIQWFLFGYSLSFSPTASFMIGNFEHLFLRGVYDQPSIGSDKIPALLFCSYQGMFAAITPALVLGAKAERARFLPTTVFVFIWTTVVYDFLACWNWNPSGWSATMGGLDFAGGTPVHISSGAAALAYALLLGPREKSPCACCEKFKPHNLAYTLLGTGILWFGWFGFNGGSALAPNMQAINACFVTNLSASVGGVVWTFLDFFQEGKWSPLGFCSGAVAGLVCITPACGYVSPASSLVFGAMGAIVCNTAVRLIHKTKLDDPVDVFAVHGVGGILGCLLTGIFAEKAYAPGICGGWLDGNYFQVVQQLIDSVAGFGWSFIVTLLLLGAMNLFPGLRLRVTPEVERIGIDLGELGVNAYEFHEDLRTQLTSEREFRNVWHRTYGDILPVTNCYNAGGGGEGRKFDYAAQQENFCRRKQANSHS